MQRSDAIFVDGIGAAAATSGILNQLQGRIFALLYICDVPLSLDDIATELDQSKSNISIHARSLADWRLVRRTHVRGSRKDHYEATTDFWRVFLEILERRYRSNVRQVLAVVEEGQQASREASGRTGGEKERRAFVGQRLDALAAFFQLLDAGIESFTRGNPVEAQSLRTKEGSRSTLGA